MDGLNREPTETLLNVSSFKRSKTLQDEYGLEDEGTEDDGERDSDKGERRYRKEKKKASNRDRKATKRHKSSAANQFRFAKSTTYREIDRQETAKKALGNVMMMPSSALTCTQKLLKGNKLNT